MGGPGQGAQVYITDTSGVNVGYVNTSGRLLVDAIINGTLNVANIDVSGETIYLPNDGVNNVVQISGQTIAFSPNTEIIARISGQTIYQQGSLLRTDNTLSVQSLSGGNELSSGAVFSALVKNRSGNADMYIGGTGTYAPFSGKGFVLEGGGSVTLNVANFNAIRVFAAASGQRVSFLGVAP